MIIANFTEIVLVLVACGYCIFWTISHDVIVSITINRRRKNAFVTNGNKAKRTKN